MRIPCLFASVIIFLGILGIPEGIAMASEAAHPADLARAQSLDQIKEFKDQLEWHMTVATGLTGLMLAASGLFTLAQGTAAYYSAISYKEEAKSAHEEAEKVLNKTLNEFKQDTKYLTNAVDLQKAAISNLESSSSSASNAPDDGSSWRRAFYEKMPLARRRELLSVDSFIPYEIYRKEDSTPEHVRNLRLLSQFYWSKFIYEQNRGSYQLGDLERADYLLERAAEKVNEDYCLLNDRGNIQIDFYRTFLRSFGTNGSEAHKRELRQLRERAVVYLTRSRIAEPKQMRAYYNLAYIHADLRQDTREISGLMTAIQWLQTCLKHENWERCPVPEFTCNAHYNLACYSSRVYQTKPASPAISSHKEHLKLCLESLQSAASIGMISPDVVRHDFEQKDGDFTHLLGENEKIRATMEELRGRLSEHYGEVEL